MIGILGGTGPEGLGLGLRWAGSGERVWIGSRQSDRAMAAVSRIRAEFPDASVEGGTNDEVAKECDVVVLAVPYSALRPTLSPLGDLLSNKLVISVVAGVDFSTGRPVPIQLPSASIAVEIEALLPNCRIASGFHTLSAEKLADVSRPLAEDTVIFGNERETRRDAIALASRISGLHAISGGKLAGSVFAEYSVGLLANLNRIYKAEAGIRFTDLKTA